MLSLVLDAASLLSLTLCPQSSVVLCRELLLSTVLSLLKGSAFPLQTGLKCEYGHLAPNLLTYDLLAGNRLLGKKKNIE